MSENNELPGILFLSRYTVQILKNYNAHLYISRNEIIILTYTFLAMKYF